MASKTAREHTYETQAKKLGFPWNGRGQIEHKALRKLKKADSKNALKSFLEPQWFEEYLSLDDYTRRTDVPGIRPGGKYFYFKYLRTNPYPRLNGRRLESVMFIDPE